MLKDEADKTGDKSCGRRAGYHHGRLKEALIEAARRLAAERGPAGFSLAEAAKRVGVTAAAPYRHFADRDALMSELARRGFAQFADELIAAWDGGTPDPTSAARRMGAAYLTFAAREPGLYASMFGAAKSLDDPTLGAAADRALEALRRACAATLAQRGAPHADARALALRVWSLAHGVAMLTVSGHLAPGRAGADPAEVLGPGLSALVEAAAREAGPAPVPTGPWGRKA
jgi:AcrR family transcriptional regulator